MPAWAQVTIELEPRAITVGDPVEMVITLPVPEEGRVIWPGPDELAPAEIIRMDTLRVGRGERSARYILSLFEPGRAELPELPVVISYPDHTDTIRVEPGVIEVESILEPADSLADIRDIRPPVKLAWTISELLPYIIIIGGLLILVVLGCLLWSRARRRKGLVPVWTPPPPPPHQLALRRLEELRVKRLWQNGYLKEYHSELTEIVKEYIGGRFDMNAPEMTTEELFMRRRRWSDGDDLFRPVRRILTCADLVKFARFKSDPSENDRNLDAAFAYVEATRPQEVSVVQTT